jgi:hypothetical protein
MRCGSQGNYYRQQGPTEVPPSHYPCIGDSTKAIDNDGCADDPIARHLRTHPWRTIRQTLSTWGREPAVWGEAIFHEPDNPLAGQLIFQDQIALTVAIEIASTGTPIPIESAFCLEASGTTLST